MLEKRLCLTILLGYWIAGALYAIYTPAWQTPDEPAHYNYIRQVVEAGCCPRIEAGDWSSEYLAQLTSGRFAPNCWASWRASSTKTIIRRSIICWRRSSTG